MNNHTDRPSRRSIISTGTTTIVLIFVLLCLLTFSVLSLVSARANMKLSQKSADRTTAYHEAENRANDILMEVNACLMKAAGVSSEETFSDAVRTALRDNEEIIFADEDTLTWTVPLAEEQFLRAEIDISYEGFSTGRHYRITAWNTYTSYDWGNDEPLPLLGSGSFPDMLTEE